MPFYYNHPAVLQGRSLQGQAIQVHISPNAVAMAPSFSTAHLSFFICNTADNNFLTELWKFKWNKPFCTVTIVHSISIVIHFH